MRNKQDTATVQNKLSAHSGSLCPEPLTTACRRPQVVEALETLEIRVAGLEKSLEAHYNKLSIVIRQEPCNGADCKERPPMNTELAERLMTVADMVAQLEHVCQSVTDKIEL